MSARRSECLTMYRIDAPRQRPESPPSDSCVEISATLVLVSTLSVLTRRPNGSLACMYLLMDPRLIPPRLYPPAALIRGSYQIPVPSHCPTYGIRGSVIRALSDDLSACTVVWRIFSLCSRRPISFPSMRNELKYAVARGTALVARGQNLMMTLVSTDGRVNVYSGTYCAYERASTRTLLTQRRPRHLSPTRSHDSFHSHVSTQLPYIPHSIILSSVISRAMRTDIHNELQR